LFVFLSVFLYLFISLFIPLYHIFYSPLVPNLVFPPTRWVLSLTHFILYLIRSNSLWFISQPLPTIAVEEPTVRMTIGVNKSPLGKKPPYHYLYHYLYHYYICLHTPLFTPFMCLTPLFTPFMCLTPLFTPFMCLTPLFTPFMCLYTPLFTPFMCLTPICIYLYMCVSCVHDLWGQPVAPG
jgi:hypothetical protein